MTVNPDAQPDGPEAFPPTGQAGPPPAPPQRPEPTQPVQPGRPERPNIRSRTGYAWTALVVAAIVLILLLVFILQNLNSVRVHMFFWEFSLPLGVGALLAAIGGALIMAIVGGMRIWQLRRATKRAFTATT